VIQWSCRMDERDQLDGTLNRRDFVKAAAAAVAVCACLGCGAEALAAPGQGGAKSAPGATGGSVDVGAITDYAKDGFINDKFIKSNRLIVARNDGKIYAFSAVCTHKFNTLTVAGDHLVCNKHHSEFSAQGTVTKGPANASLVRYAIKKNDAGHLIVDTSKSFREKDWGDPTASIAVS